MKSTIELKVLTEHIDINNHMNNKRYFDFFETGRWDYLKTNGDLFNLFKDQGISHVAVHIGVNFKASAFEGQKIRIETHLSKKSNKSITVEQWAYCGDKLLADATVVNVFIDMKTGKSMEVNTLTHLWPDLNYV
jgi:YbgC/YbaW family acyl-CoA thioester hydrolase